MIAEPGSAMIVELASHLAVPPYNRRHNPFVTGLLFKNLHQGHRREGKLQTEDEHEGGERPDGLWEEAGIQHNWWNDEKQQKEEHCEESK